MALTPETLLGHELVGLDVAVVDADNADLVGVAGTVVDETTNTLRVEGADRVRTVPKAAATFVFTLPDGEGSDGSRPSSDDASGGGVRVTVEGDRLVARPARRTETAGGSTWHSA